MRIVFFIELCFYFFWAFDSENIIQWFLYALLMWTSAYYLHKYNWEKRKSYRVAIALYSLFIFLVVSCCRFVSFVGNNITL
jgi:hypothetical protein